MRRLPCSALPLLLVLACVRPAPATAQVSIAARGARLGIGGRLHTQYQTSSVEGAINSFFIRRARINVDAEYNDFFVARIQTEFAGPGAAVLDAYVRLDFAESFRLWIGQHKRPFDLFELVSSTDLSIIERTGVIVGYSDCPGVGLICSYSRFSSNLRYSNRDSGVWIDGQVGRFAYEVSATNGNGIVEIADENDGKSFGARVTMQVTDGVEVGANVASHDYLGADDTTARAFAWGVDLQSGTWRDGFLLQAGVLGGDNWKLLDAAGDEATFTTAQVAASYYFPLTDSRIVGLEPIARVSVADPDGDTDDDGGILVTPGFMLYLLGKNKIGVNLDYYIPGTGDAEYSFRFGAFLYF